MKKWLILSSLIIISLIVTWCSKKPQTAEEIIAHSVEVHGGSGLTEWQSIVITGEAIVDEMGNPVRSEYTIYAEKPNKARLDIDMTKFERGSQIFTYLYNNGVGWFQYNLIPYQNPVYAKWHKRIYDHCQGIAFYAENASISLKSEETLDEKDVYVFNAAIESDTAILYIDKSKFHFVQEQFKNGRQTVTKKYSDFKKFGNAVYPTKILQTTTGQTEGKIEITYKKVEFNIQIETWMFEEDKPEATTAK